MSEKKKTKSRGKKRFEVEVSDLEVADRQANLRGGTLNAPTVGSSGETALKGISSGKGISSNTPGGGTSGGG